MAGYLWEVTLHTCRDSEDIAAFFMEQIFQQSPSIKTPHENFISVVSVYLPADYADLNINIEQLKNKLEEIARVCPFGHKTELKTGKLKRENWAESWKRHFKPLRISNRLLIKASWHKLKAKPGQATIVLDPGLSFGTGHHPTTSYCLKQISIHQNPSQPASFLDIGTGTGILSIAAAKLKYKNITAFDYDPESIRVALANARKNRVDHKINLFQQDLARLPLQTQDRYDVICANLEYDGLIKFHARIVKRLQKTGVLILAGILNSQFESVRQTYVQAGLKLQDQHVDGEWCSGLFSFI